jgi:outer membrane protein assembly factor BamB
MRLERLFSALGLGGFLWLACLCLPAPAADPLDWTNWRGPEQNGVSRETGLIAKWDPETGENVLWINKDLGTISTPIVMNGKLYVLCRSEPGTKREGEKVVCADAATGKILWQNVFNVFLSDVPDTRVAWSNVVGDPETGNVYALGVCDYFQCIDGETGKTLWSRSLSEEFGMLNTYGGRTNTPIVFEDLVIISGVCTNWGKTSPRLMPGQTPPPRTPADNYLAFDPITGGKHDMARPAHRFIAMDKKTGEVRWFNGTEISPKDTTYSTPTLAVLGGQAAMVFGSGDGNVYAMQPRTGKILWKYELSRKGLNVSPLVIDGIVYNGQSEENRDDNTMGAFVAIDGSKTGDITKSGELWRIKEVMVGKPSPTYYQGRIYAPDESGSLYILDPKTGEPVGGRRMKMVGTIVRASPLAADGKIYACSTSAYHVFEPTETGVKVLQRMRFPIGEECYGSPIVSHGRLYITTTSAIYCLGTKDHKPSAEKSPEPPKESPASSDPVVAHVQVAPAELLVQPGQKQQFTVRVYNSRGQLLGTKAPAMFAVDDHGEIDSQGNFTAESSARHVSATVSATVGGQSGFARVRIVPKLPWKFDFNDGQIPITWVGARYRHQPREVDGEKLIVKIDTIPLGTRSQSWMGPTELHDYTIQADLHGGIQEGKMPDMGVIAQRYTLDLMGVSQQLQIRSWTAQLEHRFAVTVPFEWKPDTWYTMKFQASNEDGKAVLRGKVWKRGEPEPKEWSIEGADPVPNVTGSPGLFGNATNAEIFIDNITVTPNAAASAVTSR